MQMSRHRYAFVATGDVSRNASFVRLRELGRQLSSMGIDVHYLLDKEEANASQVAATLDFGTVHLADGNGRRERVWTRRHQLRDIAPAAVHILNPQPGNVCTVASQGIPLVCDWDELLSSRERRFLQRYTDVLCESYARRRAALHVVASRALQSLMSHRYGIDSLYLPYACYLPSFADGPTPFTSPTAVYMGNLMPDFDHDLVIDAWELLQQRGNPLRLCVIGGGPLLEAVRDDVGRRSLTAVTVTGYVTGQPLWNHLRHAHVLLFPIRDTPGNRFRCPSKTFAYMQARRPVIANAVAEVTEALGRLGHYVEPSPEAFATAVETLPTVHPADVEYPLEQHQWSRRATALLECLGTRGLLSG